MFDKIAVLGGGAFGVALAKIAAEQATQAILWARDIKVCEHINNYHAHPHKLSDIQLPTNLSATTNLAYALKETPIVILALPMQAMREVIITANDLFDPEVIIISTAKGILASSLMLPSDIIKTYCSTNINNRACYLSGPSFAKELAHGLPTALTLASCNRDAALKFQYNFSQKNLRLYYSNDIMSVCLGGALKNVIAIAAGACTGLGLGRNALASLITRGLAEMTRLAKKMGGHAETLRGLSGMGDLVLSCTDNMSRNHQLGALLAQGLSLEQALSHIGSVVEGAQTTKAVKALAKKYHLEMPICEAVYSVLYEDMPLLKAMSALQKRVLKDE